MPAPAAAAAAAKPSPMSAAPASSTVPCPATAPARSFAPARSEARVETLEIGDEATTASAIRPIKWIGRRSYAGRFILGRRDILPVCIKAGALDERAEARSVDLAASCDVFRDQAGVLIEAKDLVNGVSIVQAERVEKVEYVHVELDNHDVIIAEGALAETYLDDDNRGMFHNALEYDTLYSGDGAQTAALLRTASGGRLSGRGDGVASRRGPDHVLLSDRILTM